MKSYTNFIEVAFMEKVKNMHKYVGFFFLGVTENGFNSLKAVTEIRIL